MKTAECRSCQAEIVFLRTGQGKQIPVDAETVTEGDELFEPRSGHVSHFATCNDPDRFRKERR